MLENPMSCNDSFCSKDYYYSNVHNTNDYEPDYGRNIETSFAINSHLVTDKSNCYLY